MTTIDMSELTGHEGVTDEQFFELLEIVANLDRDGREFSDYVTADLNDWVMSRIDTLEDLYLLPRFVVDGESFVITNIEAYVRLPDAWAWVVGGLIART